MILNTCALETTTERKLVCDFVLANVLFLIHFQYQEIHVYNCVLICFQMNVLISHFSKSSRMI